jgi:hypothetical protein
LEVTKEQFFSNVSIYCSAQIGQTAVGMIKAGKEYDSSRGRERNEGLIEKSLQF